MAELTNVINELKNNKHVEDNLPLYVKGMKSLYHRISDLHLAFHYYSYCEAYFEMNPDDKKRLEEPTRAMLQLIDMLLSDSFDSAKDIIALRNQMRDYVYSLTSYADRFLIYEYILNRVEFRFEECDYDEAYYKDGFEQDILNYLVSDRDNAVVCMKLSQLTAELPMRLSRNKFFEMLKDALTVYKGSDRQTVKDFIYRVKSAAGICDEEETKSFPEFEDTLKTLSAADYDNLDAEQYQALRVCLDEATDRITRYTDWYVMITEIINNIYSLYLTRNAISDAEESTHIHSVLVKTQAYMNNNSTELEVFDDLVALEGVQERILERMNQYEAALTDIDKRYENILGQLGLEAEMAELEMLYKLQSTSSFAELDNSSAENGEADEIFIFSELKALTDAFEEAFAQSKRLVRRAMMASVLPNLPTFFANTDEFTQYMHVSLGQCNDIAEQKACMTLIRMMME